jgi:2-polyprenyl-3-methyl-5-hydroxy-6-metoxy-1,4-benzoquinol methylase
MEQRHRYEYNVDTKGTTAAAKVVRMVGKNKRVLELGAGPGSITRFLSGYGGCHVTAIELDDEAIKKLSPFCERVYRCDLNDHTWTSVLSQDDKFEVVVAADVLEHLYDPWATLRAVRGVLNVDGYVVVSLPHIGHNAVIACLLQEDVEYRDWGLLDKTHIRFFGIENMQQLFNSTGFKIVEAEFIVLPPERTEFTGRWRRTPAELKQCLTYNRFGMVYQVVVKAKPDLSPKRGLRLLSLPIPDPSSIMYTHATLHAKTVDLIKKIVLPYLSPRSRSRLRNILHRIGLRF